MWIIMTGTYVGHHGHFVKGIKYDVPADTAGELPKGSWKETCAPCEEHTDPKAVKIAEARARFEAAKLEHATLKAEAEALSKAADSLVHPTAVKKAEASKAETAVTAAESAVKKPWKKGVTNSIKRRFGQLARAHERADQEFEKATARLRLAMAEARLKALDAEDAAREAGRLARELGISEHGEDRGQPDEQPGHDKQ